MTKHYYAASNTYGTNFTYDSGAWTVYVFETKKSLDNWVNDDTYPNGNPTRETITRAVARKIVGERVKLLWDETGTIGMFEEDTSYYNPHYWG